MAGSTEILFLAVGCFVGGHFVLSSVNVRTALIGVLGETLFRGVYSLTAVAAMVWTVIAYGAAPHVELWTADMGLTHVPAILMPFASILAVAGMTTRTVTTVGGETLAQGPHPVAGIVTVTRHPFLWAVALWAVGHIAANGDVSSLILFGGMTVLALGGMAHIDHRRRLSLGADWGPVAMTTSVVPFLATIQGRNRIDWRGIGWPRVIGGVALAAVLPFLHPWISGKTIVPEFVLQLFR
ncbi:MAG: NnrU family protein [Alphaproteobacteria bacterium]|nr:NnrU family protein [Alphaproteobacteria bacterium]